MITLQYKEILRFLDLLGKAFIFCLLLVQKKYKRKYIQYI